VEFLVIEPPHGRWRAFAQQLHTLTGGRSWGSIIAALRLAWVKMSAVEELERRCYQLRPRVHDPIELDRLLNQGVSKIDKADGFAGTRQALTDSYRRLNELPVKDLAHRPLRVGLVGEIYTVLEPFANLEVGKTLGELGVEVEQSIYLTEWLGTNLFLTAIGLSSRHDREVRRTADPYLGHFIGGHGQETVGQTILYAKQRFDGVVHLLPFTCMPEITAQSILPKVSKDYDIPVLTLVLDEQSGKAGMQTRVEAFVDLMHHRRQASSPAAR
jgi:predicted nucleotide-binding protein (sugar kinase/HSP70/actin superfamily)